MPPDRPWNTHGSEALLRRPFFTVHSDHVTTPAGTIGRYDWVAAPDLVRVAALTADHQIHIIEQHHYLIDRPILWQLPGGNVEHDEDPAAAAARELHEELGLRARRWRGLGALWPLPGLTTARVHLWLAQDLLQDTAYPDDSEADLIARVVPLEQAVTAALETTIGCAASAHLVLAVAHLARRP